jgi:ubiquinone/menaquinone biosynthesis C-methylase UbiE
MTSPLMQYIEPSQQPQAPRQGADKYFGDVAKGYDQKREADPKWVIEQRIITGMMSDLPPDTIVLDCPVGTGRFLPFYIDKDFQILGMDKSVDMLKEAAKKVDPKRARGELRIGDVRNTGLPDKCVDVAVNCRITRWLSPEDCQQMFREMQRVASKRIIWTARVANHVHARTVELFEQALQPGWKITRNEAGYVLDYRILMAELA